MIKEFQEILSEVEKKIMSVDPKNLQKLLGNIPIELFGSIQIDRPEQFPNLLNWLPLMPSKDIQQSWTGNTDHALVKQSVNFIKTAIGIYHEHSDKPINQGNILDFGCGWGRMIRLLYKYVPFNNIYGVDPWDKSIEICKECNLHGNIFLSEYIPRTLPIPITKKFDLIISFSVFTHLSEKVAKIAADTLQNYLTDNGVIAVTIRPREYWHVHFNNDNVYKKEVNELVRLHDKRGFAFRPHNREKIEGEVTFGDTSMSIEFLGNIFAGLDIVNTEWTKVLDPYQLIVFLKKTPKSQ